MPVRAVFVTGVSGSGKSTVGALLAARLGWPFLDADDLHPLANIEKMSAGIALDDADRAPWLEAVGRAADHAAGDSGGVVVACSALRRVYRYLLAAECAGSFFVQLLGGSELLAQRLSARVDHFMPPALLGSQLAVLEPLGTGEAGVAIGVASTPDAVVETIAGALGAETLTDGAETRTDGAETRTDGAGNRSDSAGTRTDRAGTQTGK
ncbi:gluconokinase [Herbiconiux sp. YIM B11900]|uniref:gluconokinase n=1 Tax=Herbiconiux sp. YIM B11900 TaxID=3404131 RepID=UPI003F86668B